MAELVDLRRADVLGRARATPGVAAPGGGAGAGPRGAVRDDRAARPAPGAARGRVAVRRDGRVYLTWTCAGLGFFQQAHWACGRLDLGRPGRLRAGRQLYSRRDGLVLGDHAGQLVRDGDRWLVATSSWGDFDADGRPRAAHLRRPTTCSPACTSSRPSRATSADRRGQLGPRAHPDRRPLAARLRGEPQPGPVRLPPCARRDRRPADWTDGLEKVGRGGRPAPVRGPGHRRGRRRPATCWPATRTTRTTRSSTSPGAGWAGSTRRTRPTSRTRSSSRTLQAGWLMLTFDGEQWHEDVMGYGGHGDVVVMHSA